MKYIVVKLCLVILFSCNAKPEKEIVQSSIDEGNSIWIDVRTKAEFNSGHLKGAINIPHNEIAKKIKLYVSDKSKAIKLYCRSGGRASYAKVTLEKLNYINVSNEGGLSAIQNRMKKD